MLRNSISLAGSSRIKPLKLSTKPFCIGVQGVMSCQSSRPPEFTAGWMMKPVRCRSTSWRCLLMVAFDLMKTRAQSAHKLHQIGHDRPSGFPDGFSPRHFGAWPIMTTRHSSPGPCRAGGHRYVEAPPRGADQTWGRLGMKAYDSYGDEDRLPLLGTSPC